MNKQKNPVRMRQHSNGMDLVKSYRQEQYSTNDKQMQPVAELLSKGAENAKTAEELLALTKLPNARQLHRQIEQERRD